MLFQKKKFPKSWDFLILALQLNLRFYGYYFHLDAGDLYILTTFIYSLNQTSEFPNGFWTTEWVESIEEFLDYKS